MKGFVALPHGTGDSAVTGVSHYALVGRKGQSLTLRIHSDTGAAIFGLRGPRDQPVDVPRGAKLWEGALPATGRYVITVWTEGEPSFFTLTVTLVGATSRHRMPSPDA